MDNFFAGVLVGKFGVKEPVLDTFFPFSVCGLTLIGSGQDDSVADSGFLWIFQFPFLET